MTPANGALQYALAAADAWRGEYVRLAGASLRVPGSRRIRLSVIGGNLRIHRLIDALARPGDTVVDVGANIGYNAVHAARRVGSAGRVVAIEPTPDNLAVLEHNLSAARVANVLVRPVAAGRDNGKRSFYVRGDTSAVNSFYPQSCYAKVTGTLEVPIERLDDLVDGEADVVKIDVEGAELEVLDGMVRLLRHRGLALIVEWHPKLQMLAGHDADALPRRLLERGFALHAVSHLRTRRCTKEDVPALRDRLLQAERPVELVARR